MYLLQIRGSSCTLLWAHTGKIAAFSQKIVTLSWNMPCSHHPTHLDPETSLTLLFLSWLGSSGASSPISRGLRYNFTMSRSRCMALKASCKSEIPVRSLEETCLSTNPPLPYSSCAQLGNQQTPLQRICFSFHFDVSSWRIKTTLGTLLSNANARWRLT